jgi:TrmH family RNA methyltransferase
MKLAKSLHLKKFREEHGMFLVEGKKMVSELIQSNWSAVAVYTTDDLLAAEWKAERITQSQMESISALSSASPCLAIVKKRMSDEVDWSAKWVLVLDEISDPGNMGTLIRTAEWFGLHQVFLTSGCVEIYNPKVLQSTMGSFFRMQFHRFSHDEMISQFGNTYQWCIADLQGESLFTATLPEKTALVVGSESHGISSIFEKHASQRWHIPGAGNGESLNAAIAGAIFMSEFFRRYQL